MNLNTQELSTINTNNKSTINKPIYYPELDGLRFFAFLLVFFHHQELLVNVPYFATLQKYGWVGMDLFFALSAFLFTKLLIAEYYKTGGINIKKFYIRRIFRIWPVYFLLIIFLIALHWLSGGNFTNNIILRIIGLFTFSENLLAIVYFNPIKYAAHLWTIAFEEQFYIIVPFAILFLVRASFKTKIKVLVGTFVLFNIIRLILILLKVKHPFIYVLPFTHFESIVLGMVIGFGGFNGLLKKVSAYVIGIIGVLIIPLLFILPYISNTSLWLIPTYSIIGISTSFILFSVLNAPLFQKICANKTLVFLGKRSYGLYLFHLLGNGIAAWLTVNITMIPTNPLVFAIYAMVTTVILAILSYKFIETPFLKWKKKFEIIESRPI